MGSYLKVGCKTERFKILLRRIQLSIVIPFLWPRFLLRALFDAVLNPCCFINTSFNLWHKPKRGSFIRSNLFIFYMRKEWCCHQVLHAGDYADYHKQVETQNFDFLTKRLTLWLMSSSIRPLHSHHWLIFENLFLLPLLFGSPHGCHGKVPSEPVRFHRHCLFFYPQVTWVLGGHH